MKKLILSAMLLLTCLIFAEKIQVTNGSNSVNVVSSNEFETILDYNVADFNRENIEIQGEVFDQLNFDLGGNTFELGSPALPKSSESIIIGADSNVDFEIISQDYVEYNMNVAPSKGFGSRQIDPATVPFQFNSNYENNDFYPQNIVSLGSPYIMRDYRGVVVNVTPFQYNHQTNTLRVYTNVRVAIRENGTSNENISRRTPKNNGYFSSLYKGHFLNFPETRYDAVEETGRMIVIAADEFADAVQPYVDWKNKKGIQTDLYLKSVAGNTAVEIKSFIQGQFDQNDGLTFVQLVGDNAQIPTFSSGGGGSDPKYALLAGGDGYPDIFVGRFSAETVSHVNTQVQRTITYERDILDGDWMQKAAGVASSEGAGSGDDGEADWQHQDVIRNKLLDYGYSEVDQLYANNGVNSQAVANSLNEGRGLFNYTGHGSTTTWVTSGFSNNDINQLTNDNMLPFINEGQIFT